MPQGSEIDTSAIRRTVADLEAKRKLERFTDNLNRYLTRTGSLHWVEYTSKVLTGEGKPVSPQTVTVAFCKRACDKVKDTVSNDSKRGIVEDYIKGFERILGIVEKLLKDRHLRETLKASDELVEDLYMTVGVEAIAEHNQRGTTAVGFVEEGENRFAVLEGAKKARVVYSNYLPVAKATLTKVTPDSEGAVVQSPHGKSSPQGGFNRRTRHNP